MEDGFDGGVSDKDLMDTADLIAGDSPPTADVRGLKPTLKGRRKFFGQLAAGTAASVLLPACTPGGTLDPDREVSNNKTVIKADPRAGERNVIQTAEAIVNQENQEHDPLKYDLLLLSPALRLTAVNLELGAGAIPVYAEAAAGTAPSIITAVLIPEAVATTLVMSPGIVQDVIEPPRLPTYDQNGNFTGCRELNPLEAQQVRDTWGTIGRLWRGENTQQIRQLNITDENGNSMVRFRQESDQGGSAGSPNPENKPDDNGEPPPELNEAQQQINDRLKNDRNLRLEISESTVKCWGTKGPLREMPAFKNQRLNLNGLSEFRSAKYNPDTGQMNTAEWDQLYETMRDPSGNIAQGADGVLWRIRGSNASVFREYGNRNLTAQDILNMQNQGIQVMDMEGNWMIVVGEVIKRTPSALVPVFPNGGN